MYYLMLESKKEDRHVLKSKRMHWICLQTPVGFDPQINRSKEQCSANWATDSLWYDGPRLPFLTVLLLSKCESMLWHWPFNMRLIDFFFQRFVSWCFDKDLIRSQGVTNIARIARNNGTNYPTINQWLNALLITLQSTNGWMPLLRVGGCTKAQKSELKDNAW